MYVQTKLKDMCHCMVKYSTMALIQHLYSEPGGRVYELEMIQAQPVWQERFCLHMHQNSAILSISLENEWEQENGND